MEKYNYFEAVKEDVLQYINDHEIKVTASNREEVEQELNDSLFIEDSVTGNGSGSYFFSTWKAEEALCHNMDLLAEAHEEFGGLSADILSSAESCDVTIRCYLLGSAISEALDEVEEEDPEEEEEEEEEERESSPC